MNRATLTGHLGRDPETRRLASGDPVVNLRLATSERWKDKATGERREATEWHSIVIYNQNLCRIAETYCKKGSRVLIEGKITTRKWTDQSGVEKYTTEIILGQFNGTLELLDSADRSSSSSDDNGSTRSREGSRASTPPAGGHGGRPSYDLDDDIPF